MTNTPKNMHIADADISACIIDALQDKKAKSLVEMDMSALGVTLFDKFIICTATSNTHAEALADNVYHKVKESLGIMPRSIEGVANAQWILLDYFNIVVHIFLENVRDFYALDMLWADAAKKEYPDM